MYIIFEYRRKYTGAVVDGVPQSERGGRSISHTGAFSRRGEHPLKLSEDFDLSSYIKSRQCRRGASRAIVEASSAKQPHLTSQAIKHFPGKSVHRFRPSLSSSGRLFRDRKAFQLCLLFHGDSANPNCSACPSAREAAIPRWQHMRDLPHRLHPQPPSYASRSVGKGRY